MKDYIELTENESDGIYKGYTTEMEKHLTYDDTYTLTERNVNYINDILRNVRAGHIDYVYKESVVEELRIYEPNLLARQVEDYWEVKIRRGRYGRK